MSIFKRRAPEPTGPVERPQVRQYRYLLGTADLPALEALHRDALATLDVLIRAHILRTSQDRTLSGRELTVDDIPEMAHLLCLGEVQTPGIIVSALTDAAVERLAHRVITLPGAAPMLEGYGGWDGVDAAADGAAGHQLGHHGGATTCVGWSPAEPRQPLASGMGTTSGSGAQTHQPEDQTVRQYRFLLRTAPADALAGRAPRGARPPRRGPARAGPDRGP